ncbi:MAG: response regulator transcription factor [Usitatibacter sp.]
MSALRILLADDHALMRAGIRALVEVVPGQTIVAEAANGRDAVALAKTHRPDLVMMDITMSELNGIEAGAQIRADNPGARVLMLSMHTSEEFVRRAMKSGASGYLVKDSAPLELQMAIDSIMRGEIYLSPRISRHLVSGVHGGASPQGDVPLESLTARHREVLQMIAEGKSTKAMAFVLKVSVKTIETHRAALMDRLGIHDLAGLVIYAVRHKLVSLEPR